MKFVCKFVGGVYDGLPMTLETAALVTKRRSPDYSKERATGGLVPRAELDSRPVFDEYLGPMWDGLRYEIDGKTYYDFELKYKPELVARVEAEQIEPYGVLRYETQSVYDALSR